MKIGITGASGFVGQQLIHVINHRPGWSAIGFTRSPEKPVPGCKETRGFGDAPDLSGLDAVINLAGASIFARWTPETKKKLIASRVDSTRKLVEAIGRLPAAERPRVLISASGTGVYGDAGERILDESAAIGTGFMAELALAWEKAALQAETLGLRVVVARIGVVLGEEGGAYAIMRWPFALGLGAQLGNGRQYMSWVHAQDLVGLFLHAIENNSVRGPLNVVGEVPITNGEFTQVLAKALRAFAFLQVPEFALKLALGEAASILLDGQRTVPAKALASGYQFKYPDAGLAVQQLSE